jgi:hypothetical protein
VFYGGPLRLKFNGVRIVHKEGAVRVAHAGGDGIPFDGQVQSVHVLGKRYVLPCKKWLSHIDRRQSVARIDTRQQTTLGTQDKLWPASFVHDVARNAPRCVTARRRKRSVCIEKRQIRISVLSGFYHSKLVKSDATMSVTHGTCDPSRDGPTAVSAIDHNKVVAKPVHFHERQAICERKRHKRCI